MQGQDDGYDIANNSNNKTSPKIPDLGELDMSIVQTEDGDKGDLSPYEVHNNDD